MQKNVTVRIKKLLDNAVVPSYATDGDAGLDMVATSWNITEKYIEYGTGISVEIPNGYVGLLFSRSSISTKADGFFLRNAVGVIDSGYRGEVKFRFSRVAIEKSETLPNDVYTVGDRIGQLIIMEIPKVKLQLSDDLSESQRGGGGYGSTGI